MNALILILELIGTVAFAASGALTGLRKNMDIFGVAILGLTTAVGGGVVSDLAGFALVSLFHNHLYKFRLIQIGIDQNFLTLLHIQTGVNDQLCIFTQYAFLHNTYLLLFLNLVYTSRFYPKGQYCKPSVVKYSF